MKDSKATSRTALLNLMLLKAWRERWSDAKWGINIKTVLPRGVSGDVYNLADCILQQAVIGSNANLLALSYLKHSLSAHLISHAAVLKRISKYESFDKVYCLVALLDLLKSIIDGVTCRGKPEEHLLPTAVVSLVLWLMKILLVLIKVNEVNSDLQIELQNVFNKTMEVIDKIIKNDFLMGILYIGKQEDNDLHQEILKKQTEININLKSSNFTQIQNKQIEVCINQLTNIDFDQVDMRLDSKKVEAITFCVQPMFTVAILVNPTSETSYYVSQMLTVQQLKGFNCSRLFYEIIRAGFIALSNSDISHDAIWSAITFMKMPHILKQIYTIKEGIAQNFDYIPDVIEALDMILEDSFVLDYINTKCEKNFIEYLLKEWAKQHIVLEEHVKIFAAKREPIYSIIPKRDPSSQAQSVINFVTCAEVPLSGILKTLSTDYNKVQEPLQEVLCQVLIGNSFDLILQVATVEGRLKSFVSRLIKCNENSRQIPNEANKSLVRSILFDVSFLMLTFIVQTYGSDIVLSESGDSFFAKWVRECMVEKNRMKYPKNMVALCDETIVDELLMTLLKPDGQLKNCNATWQEICMNIPGVLYQVLVAWENETLSNTDVKRILERIKMRPFSYSICAASYLCAYMQIVKEDEFLKPHNMVHLLIANSGAEDMPSQHQEHIKERFSLTNNIIRKMLNDVQPIVNAKIRNLSQQIVSHSPLEEQFHEVWMSIMERGWLPIKSGQVLESLLQACGPVWLVSRLVEEILKCKYSREMSKVMDIVFAIMHLDIEGMTNALLQSVVSTFLVEKQIEPQSSILARLCVYCIISNIGAPTITSFAKKRSRNEEMEIDGELCNPSKFRKINADISSADSCSNDFLSENLSNSNSSIISHHKKDYQNLILKESLQTSVQGLFKMFANFVTSDELLPNFIYQFITLLVDCGKERVKPILKLLPNNLVQSLLKVMSSDEIKVGLICRLYDLRTAPGRATAISDLCLLRNIRLRRESFNL